MRVTFEPITEQDVYAISAWRYPAPYDAYNPPDPAEAQRELLDPRSPYFTGHDEQGELVGYICFGSAAEVGGETEPHLYSADDALSFGLGMRPDLTGKGLGLAFVRAGLDFGRASLAPAAFRLYVLTWNQRAIRVYERAGFHRVRILHVTNRHGDLAFVEMQRPARAADTEESSAG